MFIAPLTLIAPGFNAMPSMADCPPFVNEGMRFNSLSASPLGRGSHKLCARAFFQLPVFCLFVPLMAFRLILVLPLLQKILLLVREQRLLVLAS